MANIKIQRTGAMVHDEQKGLLPAADLERYADQLGSGAFDV